MSVWRGVGCALLRQTLVAAAVVGVAAVLRPPVLAAQRAEVLRAGVTTQPFAADSLTTTSSSRDSAWGAAPAIASRVRGIPKRFAPLISAIIPGGGQYILGNDRGVVYAAVEFLGWLKFAKDAREKSQQESAFRDIARRVARANFSTTRPDGDWTYYEALRDWLQSGEYSLSGTDLVPETDTSTFNGYTWKVAQATTASRAQALVVYAQKAAHPDFRWSWENAQLQFDIYKRTTENRNDAAHAMTQDLTIIGLNHVISLVDAFATFRLQVRPLPDGRTSLGASLPW